MLMLIGGAGFLGKHICASARLKGLPCSVIVRDESTSLPSHGIEHYRASTFAGPAGDPLIRKATSVVFLASNSVPCSDESGARRDFLSSVDPLYAICERIVRINPAARLIFCSSGGTVYGPGHAAPVPESAPVQPVTNYALSKQVSENIIRYFAQTQGLQHAILRIANPAGRWQRSDKQGLIGIAMRCALEDRPISIFGDGHNQRDYFDADDFADLVFRIDQASKPVHGTWNAGSGVGRGELDVIAAISSVTGHAFKISHLPARSTDLRYAVVDPSNAARDFGWRAVTPFEYTLGKIREQHLARMIA